MKKLTDEQIEQQLLSALSTPPQEGLSYDFSANLHRALRFKLQRENRRKFYLVWTILFVVAITVLFVSLTVIDRMYGTQVISAIVARKWVFILGFIVIFLIQYIDYRTVKHRQIKKYQQLKDSF